MDQGAATGFTQAGSAGGDRTCLIPVQNKLQSKPPYGSVHLQQL